jgi:K+-transporting ATPase c subunit
VVVPAAGQRLADPHRRRSARFQPDWPELYRAGYFQGRPSATAETPYNPLASGGSNLAASNPALDKAVSERVQALRAPTRTPTRAFR